MAHPPDPHNLLDSQGLKGNCRKTRQESKPSNTVSWSLKGGHFFRGKNKVSSGLVNTIPHMDQG